jgi:adenine C2-methylase RlmN of 23S rRNA A2503 and tRNA A37
MRSRLFAFCVTGFFGAGRNLTPSEMLGQFFTILL